MRSFALVVVLAACTRPAARPVTPIHTNTFVPPVVTEDIAPTLAIIGPDRATFAEGAIVVSGTAHDDGVVRVTVDGADVPVAADGSFSTTIAAAPGTRVIETHAIDSTGHDVRDVRAILVGPFGDAKKRAPVAARLGPNAIAMIGRELTASTKLIDFAAAAKKLNPIYDNGGCLGAHAVIASVGIGAMDVALAPRSGAIATTITIDNVLVAIDVDYTAACLDGSTTATVRTKARVTADLGATIVDRKIKSSLTRTNVSLDNFALEINGMPGPVETMLKTPVRLAVELAIARAIESNVPPLADAKLAALVTAPPPAPILGRDVRIELVPTRVELAASGMLVAADAAFVVASGAAGRYPTAATKIEGASTSDARIWISADAIGQLASGLWAAHAFDRTIQRSELGAAALLLDERIAAFEIAPALPPTVTAGATLDIAIGELGITARDATGAELQRLTVALRSSIAKKPDELAIEATDPDVRAQLVSGEGPFDAAGLEGIVKLAWSPIIGAVNNALATIPPIGFQITSLATRDGAIVLDVASTVR